MSEHEAKIYERQELFDALADALDVENLTLAPANDSDDDVDDIQALADYIYEHHGLLTDISLLDSDGVEPGLCSRCDDYDPRLNHGLCPVCRQTGGR
ncbi:hypothetical protein [Bifidobacterium scaligerum]|uniref:Uncharacterized protein n=1 Tax=Bifidobacterium scaligerum TaxID=2052656 RepID=A0A2M9HT78_9BIFI|nr:hypothetical protein [Bifidobacterium scaligerum]PJM79988.1 hypothetical protein CUU80_02310 [Bifidobacterium scaligerum]